MTKRIVSLVCAVAVLCSLKGFAAPEFETVQVADSVVTDCYRAVNKYDICYPTDISSPAGRAMGRWLAEYIGAGRDADLSDIPTLVKAVCIKDLNSSVEELAELTADSDCEWQTGYETYIKVRLEYATPRFTTLVGDAFFYRGGAHGVSGTCGLTFITSSGKTIGYDMFTLASLRKIIALVKEGLRKQYFQCTPAEFRQAVNNPDLLTLPAAVPFFTEKGVCFQYGKYEISSYAAGRPACTIPYSVLMPYFTPAVKALLK